MTLLWTVPEEGLGAVNNSNNNALVDYELNHAGDTAKIYLYVPGNGLASYRISGLKNTGIIPVAAPTESISIDRQGNIIVFGAIVDDAWVYDINGQLVSHHRYTSHIVISSLPRGVYIIKARAGRVAAVKKIMIR